MKKQENPKASERGNAIMWVLILIALLAALSAVVSQGTRTGETTISKEQAQLAATEIINYLTAIRNAYRGLRIKGCEYENIDFTNNVYFRNNGTPLQGAPSSPKAGCEMFSPDGAGMRPITFEQYAYQLNIGAAGNGVSGHFFTATFTVQDGGTAATDPVFLSQGYKLDICLALLNKLSHAGKYSEMPISNFLPLIKPENTAVFSVRIHPSYDYCHVGVILEER